MRWESRDLTADGVASQQVINRPNLRYGSILLCAYQVETLNEILSIPASLLSPLKKYTVCSSAIRTHGTGHQGGLHGEAVARHSIRATTEALLRTIVALIGYLSAKWMGSR